MDSQVEEEEDKKCNNNDDAQKHLLKYTDLFEEIASDWIQNGSKSSPSHLHLMKWI